MSNARGSDEWEALKTAIYLHALRHEYAGRTGESDHLVNGGGDAALEYLHATIDVSRPIHEFWGDVLEAMSALVAHERATPPGALF